MGEHWESSTIKYSNTEKKISHLTNHILGSFYPLIGSIMAKNLSLYNYLIHHLDVDDKKLAQTITNDDRPVFSEKDISEIKTILSKHLNKPYVKKLLVQKGGAVHIDDTGDVSRNGFWDKFIKKITRPITSNMPQVFDVMLSYVQILYHLEKMEFYGPFISQMLDAITLSLPALADLTQELSTNIVGLIPFPYASQVGEIGGYLVSLIFIITAVFLNNSRRHFGSAFKVAIDGIPIFGDVISTAAVNFETGAQRFLGYKQKMIKSITQISPTAGEFAYSYIPDVEEHTETPPPLSDIGNILPELSNAKIPPLPSASSLPILLGQKAGGRKKANKRRTRKMK